MAGPPWGCQTAWGHSDYERCMWSNERAGLSLPVSVSCDEATASPGVFFHFSAKSALSDFDSFLYLFAFVREKPCTVTVGVSFLSLQWKLR